MWLRIRGASGRGTLQQQRDRSAQWAGTRDVRGLAIRQPDSRRLPLGQLAVGTRPQMLACPVGGSKLIVGPAGGGKTARMLVPDLLQHRGPAVVTSVKTDVFWLTLHRRADQGPIWVLNPSESAGLGSCRFSPLMFIDSFDDALRAGQWLSDAGHADDGGITGQEFWDSLARRMLAPALFLAAREHRKVAWAATEGATNAGAVTFEDVGGGQTSVQLSLEYEPEGLLEKVGDKLNIIENQAEGDLDRFKAFIESERYASGAWRGSVNEGAAAGTPTADDAASSRGDSGKAGVSGAAVAAGAGVAAAVVGGAVAAGVAGKK